VVKPAAIFTAKFFKHLGERLNNHSNWFILENISYRAFLEYPQKVGAIKNSNAI
jgi:hypothetical protein